MRAFAILYLKCFAAAVVLIASVLGAHVVLHRDRIFPDPTSLVIYGRDSCSITTAMRTTLEQEGIPYVYGNVDRLLVSDEMWHHLNKVTAQDTDPTYARFPVVLINNRTLERPDQKLVIELYREVARARK